MKEFNIVDEARSHVQKFEVDELTQRIKKFEYDRVFGQRDVKKHGMEMLGIYNEVKRMFTEND